MNVIKKDSYVLGSIETLSEKDCTTLIDLLETPPVSDQGVLGGRGGISKTRLENDLPVIIKYYRRGGFVRHFVKQAYIKSGKTRGQQEFEMLEKAMSCGVSTPRPVAWVYKGTLFYRGWLVMEEIENSLSLVDYCMTNRHNCDELFNSVIKEVRCLIKNKILHVDLHPGNILISNDKVYIIDFDKATVTHMSSETLTSFYIRRWTRAARKYSLPENLATLLSDNLQ